MAVMDSLLKDLEINEEMKNSKYLPTMIVTFFKNLELAKTRGWRASKSSSIQRARACGIPQGLGTEPAPVSDGQAHSSSSSDLEFFYSFDY